MFAGRLRLRPNIEPTLCQRLVFAGAENENNLPLVLDNIAASHKSWRMKVNTQKQRLCIYMYARKDVNLHKPVFILMAPNWN